MIGYVIGAIGVLCTILSLVGTALWRLATVVQKGNTLVEALDKRVAKTEERVDALEDRLEGYDKARDAFEQGLELLHRVVEQFGALQREVQIREAVCNERHQLSGPITLPEHLLDESDTSGIVRVPMGQVHSYTRRPK